MDIFKFGGASVKDAEGVENLRNILSAENEARIIVVSAFGKTTNNLEEITGVPVDLVTEKGLKHQLRASIMAEVIRVA